MRRGVLMLLLALAAAGCETSGGGGTTDNLLAAGITPEELERRVSQFDPAVIDFDGSTLQPWEKAVIARLVEASDVMHELFALQSFPDYPEWKERVAAYTGPGAQAVKDYFDIMVGPWDRLNDNEPFLDIGPKPPGAGFYPPDLTREEFDRWVNDHPDQKEAFTGYFTVIRLRDSGGLEAIPYSDFWRPQLERAAALLREAADISQNASLSDYLRKRADAFLSNDYFESDVAWMDITGSRVEPTIGPYEVYEDALFAYKAAFESFVTVADSAASVELQRLKDWLPRLEAELPMEDRFKNPNRGFESPIRVVDVAYTAGDARRGVQTTAFNLPNDVRVTEQKGSKKVMLRNVSRAKFQRILAPIAQRVLDPALTPDIAFQPWFVNVVMHELAHGLGPTTITTPAGERTSVNQALREHYSALEELKADVTGLHNLTVLVREGIYDEAFLRAAFIGHLADHFRAVRFGTSSAHGRANLIQLNWMMEKGALRHDAASGTFHADLDALRDANRALAAEVLSIQATGDYARAGDFIARYTTMRPELASALGKLGDVPVDIRPQYPVREKIAEWRDVAGEHAGH